jgi:hypothetical protein
MEQQIAASDDIGGGGLVRGVSNPPAGYMALDSVVTIIEQKRAVTFDIGGHESYEVKDGVEILEGPISGRWRNVMSMASKLVGSYGRMYRYFIALFDIVHCAQGRYLFVRPKANGTGKGRYSMVRLRVRSPFVSPRIDISGLGVDDGVAAACRWFAMSHDLRYAAGVGGRIEGYNVMLRVIEAVPAAPYIFSEELEEVIDFGGKQFALRNDGASHADIAKIQLRLMVEGGQVDQNASVMKWMLAAMGSVDRDQIRLASRASSALLESYNYCDPLFRNGCLASSDLEEGVLVFTHRWDGSPIALLKSDYAGDFVGATGGVSKGKGRFFCNYFRTFVTMNDGRTHIHLRLVVVDGARWWVWSTRARGWFSCKPPRKSARRSALRTGRFDVRINEPKEFIPLVEMQWDSLDFGKELQADMGNTIELDPLSNEMVILTPSTVIVDEVLEVGVSSREVVVEPDVVVDGLDDLASCAPAVEAADMDVDNGVILVSGPFDAPPTVTDGEEAFEFC